MIKDLEKQLTAKQINPTAMRLLVLDFLLKQDSATSLADLEKGMVKSDRITLYRTLKTFQEKGMVHSIETGSGTKYALCHTGCSPKAHQDIHVHFYCLSCKETFCLPQSSLPQINLPDRFQLEEINLTAKGVCEKCVI